MPARMGVAALASALRPGERVFVPGSTGEPSALLAALRSVPGLDVLSTAVPGINPVAAGDFGPGATVTLLFMQPQLRAAEAEGRFRHLPLSYAGFVRHLREAAIDTCLVQVSPPDAAGMCSLGAAVEFTALAHARAARTLAVINPLVPDMERSVRLPYASFAAVAEAETALPVYDVGAPSAEAGAIAGHVAGLIGDGFALQAGLGKVPEALFALLADRRGLRLQSGMLSDGALRLAAAGALDRGFAHRSCVWVGSAALYRALPEVEGFRVLGCERTHDVAALAAAERFVAVNSALSVDLWGQANLERAGGRGVSGVGGAPDFAQAARRSAGGISVVALPSTFGTPARSRIVAALEGPVSLPRQMVDVVVTEHGVADLRGQAAPARAERLIAVAAPGLRGELAARWRALNP